MTPDAREREVKHLRQAIGTAKVVVALTAAIAATFVAGTLQVNSPETWWDHASAVLMAFTIIVSFWLVTRPVPPHAEIDGTAFRQGEGSRASHALSGAGTSGPLGSLVRGRDHGAALALHVAAASLAFLALNNCHLTETRSTQS